MSANAALEPQSVHLHNGTLNDRSRETTRFGEGQLSQERTQFPETSVKKTDGCLQRRSQNAVIIQVPDSESWCGFD